MILAAPLIPYIQIPNLTLIPQGYFGGTFPPVPFSIKPFGTLVATGVYLGGYLAVRQGKKVGLDERALTSFIFWVVGIGFIGGHVLNTLFYYPERVLTDPLDLLRLWNGLSSFGGFIGGIAGAFLWGWRHKTPILPYCDMIASAFPVAWVFGRTGCTVAHGHPGIRSAAWFAVQYPGGSRLDCGFYEMLLTIPLAAAFLWLRRKPRPWGFYVATMSIAYAPTRFALDFLRARDVVDADARYFSLTPAQWACLPLLAFGVLMFWSTMRRAETADAIRPPPPPERLVSSEPTKAEG